MNSGQVGEEEERTNPPDLRKARKYAKKRSRRWTTIEEPPGKRK